MMRLPAVLRGARAAGVFLTRVPLGGFPYTEADWRWASAWFPFVGACLGAVMAGVYRATAAAGPLAAAALAVAAGLLLTGAFHEDGLADTADALGGAYDREQLFAILKDSRIGAHGAAALGVVLVLRIALLARLEGWAPAALVLSQCLARTPPIWLMVALPYVTSDATSRSRLVTRASWAQGLLATLWPVVLGAAGLSTGALSPAAAGGLVLALAAVAAVCGWRFHVRAGGITGDFLGATEQVAECAVLLVLALALGGGA